MVLGTGGAEQLPPRQFLTVMEQLHRGVAFAPSDEDIQGFLGHRPVLPHPAPTWLQSGLPDVLPAPTPNPEEQIRGLLTAGWSLQAIQREVFGYSGGAAYEAVRAVQDTLNHSIPAHD